MMEGSVEMPTILGATQERSKSNAEDLEDVEARLDRVETYAKIHAGTLSILAAQALGIPTQKIFQLLSSLI